MRNDQKRSHCHSRQLKIDGNKRAEKYANCVCGVRETFDVLIGISCRTSAREGLQLQKYFIYKKAKLLNSLSFLLGAQPQTCTDC